MIFFLHGASCCLTAACGVYVYMKGPLHGQNCWRSASADLVKTEPSANSSLRLLGNRWQQRLTVWRSGSSRLPLLDFCCSFFFPSFLSFFFTLWPHPSPHPTTTPVPLHFIRGNLTPAAAQASSGKLPSTSQWKLWPHPSQLFTRSFCQTLKLAVEPQPPFCAELSFLQHIHRSD